MLIRRDPPRVRAYMLRYWQVRSDDPNCAAVWRFSLEDPHNGDKFGFANLQALVEFLEAGLTSDCHEGSVTRGPAEQADTGLAGPRNAGPGQQAG